MDKALVIKNSALAALAAMGSGIAHALGGWDAALEVLVWMMVADYITGFLVAGLWQSSNKSETGALDSKAGFRGICKKVAMLGLVGLGVLLDDAMGSSYIRAAIMFFFIGNEGLSLLENLGLMGVPFPAFLRRALEALRENGDSGEAAG